MKQSRGIRNNNPGNIDYTSSTPCARLSSCCAPRQVQSLNSITSTPSCADSGGVSKKRHWGLVELAYLVPFNRTKPAASRARVRV